MRTVHKKTRFTDVLIQSLLLCGSGLSILMALSIDKGFLIFGFILWFFLGFWQLGSALIGGILMPSATHLTYLVTASLYLVIIYFVGENVSFSSFYVIPKEAMSVVGLGIIPAIGAIWYLSYSIRLLTGEEEID